MLLQLKSQRNEILTAKDLIDERRRFSEAVLAGVTAGVIGVDPTASSPSSTARPRRMLAISARAAVGQNLLDACCRMSAASSRSAASRGTPGLPRAGHLLPRRRRAHLQRPGDRRRRRRRRGEKSYVVTVDDITDLVAGAALVRLGRRRAPHRARDQEPADADPAFGRAHPPPLRQGHHRGSRGLRPVHRHDHPPGRATSAAWSTSSPPSPACRSPR